jgi:isoleucyl-tRNA synthetase
LTRLLAPIIPHTAEDLWEFLPATETKQASVHLALLPERNPSWDQGKFDRDGTWGLLRRVRTDVFRDLERLRLAKEIGSSQEASIRIGVMTARCGPS